MASFSKGVAHKWFLKKTAVRESEAESILAVKSEWKSEVDVGAAPVRAEAANMQFKSKGIVM